MFRKLTDKFDCHWGLPNDFVSSNRSKFKTIDEIIDLCDKMDKESHIYVYFPVTTNRICIHVEKEGFINVDLQYSDPVCEGVIEIEHLRNIFKNYERFQEYPEEFGLSSDEA